MRKKDAYLVNFKGQKLYFEFNLAGFDGVRYLAYVTNMDLFCKLVKVSIDKYLLSIDDFSYRR